MATQNPYHSGDEKVPATHVENGVIAPAKDVEAGSDEYLGDTVHRQWKDVDEGLDPKEVARIVRRVDWRLLPILAAMYTISQIDRSNLSLARSANNKKMDAELGLDVNGGRNNRYTLITLAFFIPYLVLEVPVSTHPGSDE